MADEYQVAVQLPALGTVSCSSSHSSFFMALFPGVDIALGPEMKSTGEVMGIDTDFGRAYCKSQLGAFQNVPTKSTVFMSVKDRDKTVLLISTPRQLSGFGFSTISTAGTAAFLAKQGIEVDTIHRVSEGKPNILDAIHGGNVQLIINTPSGKIPRQDEVVIRDDQERKWNRNFDIRDNLFHQLCGDMSLHSDSPLPINPWRLSRTEGLRLDQPLQRFLAGIEILRRLPGE